MLSKIFLETFPLYKRLNIELGYYEDGMADIPRPAINLFCKPCNSIQTFNMINKYWENETDSEMTARRIDIWGKTVRAVYQCSACNNYQYLFFLEFIKTGKSDKDENVYKGYIRKVGQNPPWEIEIDKSLEKLLNNHADLYKKGLVCESQSYGIGAYSYFRRIIEKIIDELLAQIPDLIEDERDRIKYLELLEKTKKEKNAESKIKLVKDLLPKSLRSGDLNPLEIIYSSLSEGLHGKEDDECMEMAEDIKNSLIFLIKEVSSKKSTKSAFTDSMRKLLERKQKSGSK